MATNPSLIGQRAAVKLNDEISFHDKLRSEIDITANNKPVWDGDIVLYKNSSDSVDNYDGRIRVQVKGKEVKKQFSGKSISFKIKKKHLAAFNKDNGGLFFVVELTKDNKEYKIYYKTLLPIDIIHLLRKCGEKKELPVTFDALEEKKSITLYTLCQNFMLHKKLQSSDAVLNLNSINMKTEQVFVKFISEKNKEMDYFLENEQYLYTKDISGSLIPIGINKFSQIFLNAKISVCCGDTEFYNEATKITDSSGDFIIRFGKLTTINFTKGQYSFKIEGTLKERLHDLNFIIPILKREKELYTNGERLSLSFNSDYSEMLKDFERWQTYFNDVVEMLNYFNIDKDIDIFRYDKNCLYTLYVLTEAVIRNKIDFVRRFQPESILGPVVFPDLSFSVAKVNDKLYNYYGRDFISLDVSVSVGNETTSEISPYANASVAILKADNFNKEVVISSISKYDLNELSSALYAHLFMNMMLAWDINQKESVYEAAEYLVQILHDYNPNPRSLINKMQLIKRKRDFTDLEKSELIELENEVTNHMEQTAIQLLWKNKDKYNYYFNKLSDDEKNEFQSWAIYAFHKAL